MKKTLHKTTLTYLGLKVEVTPSTYEGEEDQLIACSAVIKAMRQAGYGTAQISFEEVKETCMHSEGEESK